MSVYQCEFFGHFVYSEELSYIGLLEREAALMDAFDRLLRDMDAAHIDFTPTGDALRAQCVFARADEALFHSVCDAIAPLLGDDVEGKLLFVDKNLEHVALYCLAGAVWKEASIALPEAGDALRRAEPDPEPSAAFPFTAFSRPASQAALSSAPKSPQKSPARKKAAPRSGPKS